MNTKYKNCWEIKDCLKYKGKEAMMNCMAHKMKMGHSCWVVAGDYVSRKNAKDTECMDCEVFRLYHRKLGDYGKEISKAFPREQRRYEKILINRIKDI